MCGPPPEIIVRGRPSMADIQRAVAWRTGVTRDEIVGNDRRARIVVARQIAVYLCRLLTTRTFSEIGRMFGRDHTTVMEADRRIADILEGTQTSKYKCRNRRYDERVAGDVAALKEMLAK